PQPAKLLGRELAGGAWVANESDVAHRRDRSGLHDRCECLHDACELLRRRETRQQTHEMRMLYAGDDVLPAIGPEHADVERTTLIGREIASGDGRKVLHIRSGLSLQQAIDA